MRKQIFFLNGLLIGATLFCSAQAREIEVSTTTGNTFVLEMSSEAFFGELENQIEEMISPEEEAVIVLRYSKEPDYQISKIRSRVSAKKHGQSLGFPRDYYVNLSYDEVNDIRFIITFLANRSFVTIATHRGALEEAGERIEHIHPLRFLATVFTDEELKVGMRNVRGKGLIWGDFSGGLKTSLSSENSIGNITDDQILDFANTVKIAPSIIYASIKQGRWDEFIDLLITHVPRNGDHNRYDS